MSRHHNNKSRFETGFSDPAHKVDTEVPTLPTANGVKRMLANSEVLLAILIILVAFGSFFLGRLSTQNGLFAETKQTGAVLISTAEAEPDIPTTPETLNETSTTSPTKGELPQADTQKTGYVASKQGTKYHLPWCSGALRIKEENKVWFGTKEEAEKAGYTPAANCKGL